jgi:tetratricopeptide (TPR) repeat protein
MSTKEASTSKPVASGPGREANGGSVHLAVRFADDAEEILARYVKPGKWPSAKSIRAFRQHGDLESVLSLYEQAMEHDPAEPAYPWNLASSLDRLGASDLAVAYMRRAIRIAAETNDQEWAGADAYLALADIALRASDTDIAALAIDNARHLDPDAPIGRYQRRLRRHVESPAARPTSDYDSARKGTAVEHLIAATCMLASDFELNVSTSLVDDEGVDLVFHRRERSTTLAVQIKSRSWSATTMRDKQRFIAQVRASTFKPRPDLFMLFVAIDPRFADYGPVWLIPSEVFAATLNGPRDKLRFAASAAPGSADRWIRYRHERPELPRRLLDALENLERAR